MTKHPAKFSDEILDAIRKELYKHFPGGPRVLDPFAGTGKIHILRPWATTVGVEIEPEWAEMSEHTVCANALSLPFEDDEFDAIATSCVYGNRMSDHHDAKDGSVRNTYKHALGRDLHPENSGSLHFGDKYKEFHIQAWKESLRVLRPGGVFLLNISDFIKSGEIVSVSAWHIQALQALGAQWFNAEPISTHRLGFGANAKVRVSNEWLLAFRTRD